MTFPAIKYTLDGDRLTLDLPAGDGPKVAKRCAAGFARVTIDRPGRPRTTGERSQNHFINGACQIIAQATGNDFDVVKYAMKHRAIKRGYPAEFKLGAFVPFSETRIDTKQAGFLIDEIHAFCAEFGIDLEVK